MVFAFPAVEELDELGEELDRFRVRKFEQTNIIHIRRHWGAGEWGLKLVLLLAYLVIAQGGHGDGVWRGVGKRVPIVDCLVRGAGG